MGYSLSIKDFVTAAGLAILTSFRATAVTEGVGVLVGVEVLVAVTDGVGVLVGV